jgi:alkanesulfonate monooxygenase SsuD/methylene tetrahydromethanopterin reductase-like flavin-dependent oxidoreductase (luciferase family)
MPGTVTTYGVVLPHFGPGTSRRGLLEGARTAERAGYACVWARDHVAYEPHPWEPASELFLEQYVSLAAVAAVTDSIAVGAGATIPFRSAHHVATLARSLSIVAERTVNIGLGLGDYAREMAMSGLGEADIPARRRETMDQLQAHRGLADAVELWWAGSGPRALATAARRRVNWLGGRQPLSALRQRMAELEQVRDQAGWRPRAAVWVLVDFDAEAGRSVGRVPIDLVGRFARGGATSSAASMGHKDEEHWRGSVLRGDAERIQEDLESLRALGVDHVVLDFRFSPAVCWAEDVEQFATRFLPEPALPVRDNASISSISPIAQPLDLEE